MSVPRNSLLGRQLDEYLIDQPLGVGAMGHVYRALDTKLHRQVAIKVISSGFRANAEYKKRFEQEAQSIARLDHPNIVHVYRFGEVENLYYLVMQYIDGADLEWLINDYRRADELVPVQDVIGVVRDISAALDYAHSKNVIHRDVKPGNIVMNSAGQAILTDFGLALFGTEHTTDSVDGTPQYMAPEQVGPNHNVLPQSDLYALGITLYEMLTGELPFDGGTPLEITMRQLSEPPIPPSHVNRAIPAAIDEVVLRSLKKQPDERYQTGAEFAAAFETAATDWLRTPLPVPVPAGATRRPSQIMVTEKVSTLLNSSALFGPMLAAPVPEVDPVPLAQPSAEIGHPTFPAVAGEPPQDLSAIPSESEPRKRRGALFYGVIFATALFVGALIGLFGRAIFANASQRGTIAATMNTVILALPTTSPEIATDAPTNTAPPSQVMPTLVPSAAPPTNTQVSTTMPPTATQSVVPPDNRNSVPPNSQRLGEFAVEAYCNTRGYGVRIANQTDWVCFNRSTGAVALVLDAPDFDSICRSKYNNPLAFAIRDQQKPVLAYDWSCYAYTQSQPPVTVNGGVGATPSLNTLLFSYGTGWIALVNISPTLLSLAGVEFQQGTNVLSATAWGHTALNSGECLRIYAGDTPPQALPPSCSTVYDYTADSNQRGLWFAGKVEIIVNPSTKYCYPSSQC